jgi:hypothetical protein
VVWHTSHYSNYPLATTFAAITTVTYVKLDRYQKCYCSFN